MHIKANLLKDVGSIESFLSTDIAAIAIWDMNDTEWINSEIAYQNEFNPYFEEGVQKLENAIIGVSTGFDSNFKVTINFNNPISQSDEKLVYKSEKGIKLHVNGMVCVSSPEWIGYRQAKAIEDNLVDTIELRPGDYIVDAYALLTRNPEGKPQFVQFLFSLYLNTQYPDKNAEIKSIDRALPFKYVS